MVEVEAPKTNLLRRVRNSINQTSNDAADRSMQIRREAIASGKNFTRLAAGLDVMFHNIIAGATGGIKAKPPKA